MNMAMCNGNDINICIRCYCFIKTYLYTLVKRTVTLMLGDNILPIRSDNDTKCPSRNIYLLIIYDFWHLLKYTCYLLALMGNKICQQWGGLCSITFSLHKGGALDLYLVHLYIILNIIEIRISTRHPWLVQDCSISIANTLPKLQSFTKPSICYLLKQNARGAYTNRI